MRNWIAVILWLALSAQAATPVQVMRTVDLDKPGALERLKAERPKHYAKVVEEMDKVQAVPRSEQGQHSLRFNPATPDPTRRQIETSDPAKTRVTIPVEDTLYSITVLYTKNPATLSHAK